jgi:sugar transferase (PEP-CTERM/EpsH1 system associated)
VKLLFLTPQLPYPPRQGTALRNWGLIQHLSRQHTITLLSFVEGEVASAPDLLRATVDRAVSLPAPQRTRAARLRALLAGQADLAGRLVSPGYARALEELLREERFDFAHIEALEMAAYLPQLKAQPQLKLIFDAHNAEHVLQRRAFESDRRTLSRWPTALYSWIQWPRLRRFEAETVRAVQAVTCVSPEDAAALRAVAPGLNPLLVPNGIDVESYTQYAQRAASAERNAFCVTFTGKMDYRPNVDGVLWFADAIWPLIRAQRPEAQFSIVGQKPVERVRALHGRDGIAVTGAVEDIRPHIAQAAVYVAPLRMGGGTRFKLLEAMALGKPIVSTTLGAEGFAVQGSRELLLADEPEAFAHAVLTLMEDSASARALGEAGRAFVRAHYDWSVIIPAVERLYAELSAAG